jgi:urease subunit alpha
MFGAFGGGLRTSVTFVSEAALSNPEVRGLGLARPLEAVRGTRSVGKRDMVHNDAMPKIEVDPETYEVRADGELLTCEPAKELPLAQRYFLF